MTAADAAQIFSLLRHDLAEDDDAYYILVEAALNRASDDLAATDILAALPQRNLHSGTDGDDVIETGNVATAIFGDTGDDLLKGGDKDNKYLYFFGDGNDVILDIDLSVNSGTDTLSFVDVASTDATLIQGADHDLIISLANGETVTVQDHFMNNHDHAIETISFADGVSLDGYQAIRDRSVRDQVELDQEFITGSTYTENYIHNAGEGSYTILDVDLYSNSGTDTLTFADVSSTDATVTRGEDDDLIVSLANGETVTVQDHFTNNHDHAIETISFADGVSLDGYQAIRDRSVRDQVELDQEFITGSTYTEKLHTQRGRRFVHNPGRRPLQQLRHGHLTFADVSSTDATVTRGEDDDLIISLANGETVTVQDHFTNDHDHAIETISFADGVSLDGYQAIRDRSVADALSRDLLGTAAGDDLFGSAATDTLNGGAGKRSTHRLRRRRYPAWRVRGRLYRWRRWTGHYRFRWRDRAVRRSEVKRCASHRPRYGPDHQHRKRARVKQQRFHNRNEPRQPYQRALR